MFSAQAQKEIELVVGRYPSKRSALLPVLYIAQREHGYLSEPVMREVARLLDLTPPQVYEVVSFYTMFYTKPVGKHHIQVCKTLSCGLVGAAAIVYHLQSRLGIQVGETTPDGLFSLQVVECLASCGTGPMMQINEDYYENLTVEKVDRILQDLKRDGKSPLASGPFMLPVMDGQGSGSG